MASVRAAETCSCHVNVGKMRAQENLWTPPYKRGRTGQEIFHFPGEGKKGSVFAAALRGSTGSYQHKSRLIRTVTDPKCPHKHETAGPACASAGPLSSGSV